MNGQGAVSEPSLAANPVFCTHVHAKRRARFLGVGYDVDFMAVLRKAISCPVGPHADAALDRRIFADDTNSQRRSSKSPASPRSAIRPSALGNSSTATQASSAASRSKTSGVSSKMPISPARKEIASGTTRSIGLMSPDLPSKIGRTSKRVWRRAISGLRRISDGLLWAGLFATGNGLSAPMRTCAAANSHVVTSGKYRRVGGRLSQREIRKL